VTKRPPKPTWREQPPTMAVCILAGTGPTAKAAKYLDELAAWVRDARRQMPKERNHIDGGTLFAASEPTGGPQ
jgi:hypothetical protein